MNLGEARRHDPAAPEGDDGAWKWIEIPFSCMTSGNWGFPANQGDSTELLTSEVVGIQFQVTGANADEDPATPALPIEAFDFSIDNLSFLEKTRTAANECN